MYLKLALRIFLGKCHWCNSNIPIYDIKRSINETNVFLVCSKCRGEVDSFFYQEEDNLEDFSNEINVYAKGLKHISKRLNKLIEKYNVIAKEQRIKSISHFDVSIRLHSDDISKASLSESKYSNTYCNLFELNKCYSNKVEKYLIDYGKLSWNLYNLKKVFDIILKEYNDLVEKYNSLSITEKRGKILGDTLLNKILHNKR